MTLEDAELRRIIRDAAGYAGDAPAYVRYSFTAMSLERARIRLVAARKLIEQALSEIDRRLDEGEEK